ncbi:MAG TPA: methyltransferase domain-containing protein [Solirubrobacteraceae bacterium]|nr:methyltransferase domain-containing protein [Solirubrobacteraceae bacterium]
MSDLMMRVLGWRSLLIHGDPCVLDRWLWLRPRLRPGPARTLDAGCGNGAFSIYAARRGNQVLATSFSERELDDARRRTRLLGLEGVEFEVLDLRDIDSRRDELGSFDQIICLETIEHLSDDQGLLESLAGLLEPGGQLLLSTPFEGHRPLYSEERDPSPVEDGSHVRYGYSADRLQALALAAGLQPAQLGYVSGVVSQRLTNLMRRLTLRLGRMPAWVLMLPLRPLVVLDRPLSRLARYPYLSIAMVARRDAGGVARRDA